MIIVQLAGLSGSGKTTLSRNVAAELEKRGLRVEVIDGDEYRKTICKGLGFSKEDRYENLRRLGAIAKVLARHGVIAIISAVNPYEEIRRELNESGHPVKTVWIDCDLRTLQERDTKGLYRRAALPDGHPDRLDNLTGVNDPFEPPETCDLIIRTGNESIGESAEKLLGLILASIGMSSGRQRAFFIGRWQPFHNGHKWLVDQKLSHGIPVLIAVRDMQPDAQNPLSAIQTAEMLRKYYAGKDVEVMIVPDIESVNFGRRVGYEVNEFKPPPEIEGISATEIREHLRAGSDGWRENVDADLHPHIVEHFNGRDS